MLRALVQQRSQRGLDLFALIAHLCLVQIPALDVFDGGAGKESG